MRYMTITVMIFACCLVGMTAHAGDIHDEGHARITPWSGYWWPHFQGLLLKPLGKYDSLTGKQAAAWERKTHPPGPGVPRWHGYCHAWAASSLMEQEPIKPRAAQGMRGRAELGVDDQKGLLAACHARDAANTYGDRYGDGHGSEDKQDLPPDALWRLLKLYIKEQGVPLVLDVEAGDQVWNYPVYAYRIVASPTGDQGKHTGSLTLWMSDDAVRPDYVGVQVRRQTYRFSFELRGGSVVMGSGRWIGPSVEDHPDFAWYPFVAVAENPEVEYAVVQQFVGTGTAAPRPQPEARPQPAPQPQPRPEPQPTPASPRPDLVQPTPPRDPDNPTTPQAPSPGAPVFALSPLELVSIITDKTSSFGLDATVDRFDGGAYQEGDEIRIRLASGSAGYLYLLHVSSQGNLTLLFPQPGQDNRVSANQSVEIPAAKDKFVVRAAQPFGTSRIKAVVTSRPLSLTGLLPPSLDSQQQQAQSADNPGQGRQEPQGPTPKAEEAAKPARPPARRQQFRWHPTQQQQVQRLLRQYRQDQSLPRDQFGDVDPRAVLGAFAHDEIAYYVGPREGDRQGTSQSSRKAKQN
ncbi:MAG: DUF4384 domain-containing protein [Pirellulaceae bacterium]